ncbi:MAG: hypothetical protein ACYDB4_15075 [Candidatus Dormibacteraceae bacterium]
MDRRLRQMVKFKDQLPGRMARVDAPLPAAGQDVIDGDLAVLEVQRNRNQGRIDFWSARQWGSRATCITGRFVGRLTD